VRIVPDKPYPIKADEKVAAAVNDIDETKLGGKGLHCLIRKIKKPTRERTYTECRRKKGSGCFKREKIGKITDITSNKGRVGNRWSTINIAVSRYVGE